MAFLIADTTKLWDDGIVPYTISAADFPVDSDQRSIIHEAINEINTKTNVWLKPRQRGEENYVVFEKSASSCSSSVGMVGGKQSLACAIGDKFGVGNVVHEIMHVLGFLHEHQRPDRDEWVYVDLANIKNQNDFLRYDANVVRIVADYDYASITHYPSIILNDYMVFDSTKETIKPLKPLTTETILGQRGALSNLDIQSVNAIYTYVYSNKSELLPVKVSFWWVLAGVIFIFIVIALIIKNK